MKLLTSLVLVAGIVGLTGCPVKSDLEDGKQPIVVIGFDEHDTTLQGIIDGEVHGTVVQNPYMYGHQSVEILARLARNEPAKDVLPENGFQNHEARQIRQDNVHKFWEEKKSQLAAGEGQSQIKEGRPTVAYITNGVDPFWTIAAAGAKAAGNEFNVNVLLRFPANGVGDQKQMIQDLLVQDDVTGLAISPINPENQAELLDQVGATKHYITHDSDAPKTNRLAYIGMENYQAGRLAGELIKEAMPDGGTVMIFVGRLGQLNAEQRRQGVIDELLDREFDPERRDPNEKLKGDKYTILGTRTDDFDQAKAKQNAQDAIAKYPDLGCMVGLFAYNPPQCLQAVQEAGRQVRTDE
jgi:ABC-type sugar transport system substrate-binding protein